MSKRLTITEVADRLRLIAALLPFSQERGVTVYRIARVSRFDAKEVEKWTLTTALPRGRKRHHGRLLFRIERIGHSREERPFVLVVILEPHLSV
jgi:hypothetical protein